MTRYHPDQAALPLPAVERPKPDFPTEARKELTAALAKARAAVTKPPWSYRDQGYWRIVFRQMAGWLPAVEAETMCDEFYRELERVELLFPAGERKTMGEENFGDLSNAEIVAQASGRKPNDRRWTVLSIYRVYGLYGDATVPSFVAEIVGETKEHGEQRRVRQDAFDSVIDALTWGAFNQKSALFQELQRKATRWLEDHVITGMVPVKMQFGAPTKRLRLGGGPIFVKPGEVFTVEDGPSIQDRAIELLREIVEAAASMDDDRIQRSLEAAAEFLEGLGDAGDR